MDTSTHNLAALFAQLGLDNSDSAINAFTQQHRLDAEITLEQASFWSPAQAAFIHEAWQEDSDWAEIVDQLDSLLRD